MLVSFIESLKVLNAQSDVRVSLALEAMKPMVINLKEFAKAAQGL